MSLKPGGEYVSMKLVWLFCFSHWDLPNHNSSCCILGTIGKSSMSRGAWNWFHNVLTYSEYWTIFSLKIYLNQSENYKQIWRCSWHCWESPHWVGFNEGDLKKFRLKIWKILNFKYFLLLKIQLHYKKWFWKERSWANEFTLEPMAWATLVLMKDKRQHIQNIISAHKLLPNNKVIHEVAPCWCPLAPLFATSSLVFVLLVKSQDRGPRRVQIGKTKDGIPKFSM